LPRTPPVGPIAPKRTEVTWEAATATRAVLGSVLDLDGAEVATLEADTLSYTFSTLSPGTVYTVSISAFDAEGNASDPGLASQTFTSPVPVTGLWGAWGFEGVGTEATDTSGNQNHGIVENGAQRGATGYFGAGLELFGTAGNVDLGGLDVYSAGMTIMMWIRADDFGVIDARLISKSTGSKANEHIWMLSTITGPSLRFRLMTDDGQDTATLIGSGGTLSTGTWIHAAATYDGTTMRLYQDGVEVGATPKTGAIARDPGVSAWIGGNPGEPGQVFDGFLDEVKIIGRALTPAEIQAEMGQAVPPFFDDEDPTPPLNLIALATSSSSVNLSWDAATDNAVLAGYRVFQNGVEIATTTQVSFDVTGLNPETTYSYSVLAYDAAGNESTAVGPIDVTTDAIDVLPPTVPGSFLAVAISATRIDLEWTSSTDNVGVVGYRLLRDGVEVALLPETQAVYSDQGLSPDTTYTYELFAFDAEGNSSAAATDFTTTLATISDLWGAWGFEEGGGTDALDSSGNGHDGVLENGADRNVDGYFGSALETNGSSGNVNLGTLDIPSGELTIMCWINADDFGVDDARILSKSTSASSNDHVWMLSTIDGPSLRFRLKTDDGSDTSTLIGSGGTFAAGTWVHAAATYDGSTMRLFQDGVEVGSAAKSGAVAQAPTVAAWIGGNPGRSNQVFDGRIDEVKVFSRALSAAEIQTEMDQPAPPFFDDQAPTTPGNFQGVATSTMTVDLNWDEATDNFFVAGYRVLQDSVEIGTTTQLSFAVAGLAPATSYGFSVIAFDSAGNESGAAGPVAVVTDAPDSQPPTVPGSFVATALSTVRIDLGWTSSTDNVAVVGYRLLRDGVEIAVLPDTLTSFVDLGLSPGTSYSYEVSAFDALGNESAPAGPAVATTDAADTQPPTVPAGFAGTAVATTAIDLSWTGSTDNVEVAGYRLFRGGVEIASLPGTQTSYADQGLSPDTGYSYELTAFDTSGNESAASGPIVVTTLAPDIEAPTVPAGFAAAVLSETRIDLSWTGSTDNVAVAGYRLLRGGVEIASLSNVQTTYADQGLSPDTSYSYELTAFDTSGNESAAAGPVVASTLAPDTEAPTVPGNVFASAVSATRIDVDWTNSTDNVEVTGYRLLRDGAEIALLPGSQTSYVDQGLVPETTYAYEVFAFDAAGNFSGGATGAATTLATTLGLLGAWGFEEGGGLDAYDSSGNANDGLFEGGAARSTSGYFGETLQTNGVAGNVDLGNLDIPTTEMTIMAWINADDFGVSDARIISKSTSQKANDHWWMLSTIGGPSLRFRLKTDDGLDTTTLVGSGGTFSAGTWVHAAATYDGTTMRLFQDGVEVGSAAKSGAIAQDPTVAAWIGG
ncbi:MAG: LamG-like jellyroll fold domain-containing protein, partial [Planctomycetota bacterium]